MTSGEKCRWRSSTSRNDTPLDLEEVKEFLRGRLARYKIPKRIVVVGELPKTGTGKIQKFILREQTRMDAGSSQKRIAGVRPTM
jgi:acyl-CoA synthetase (AMP-forming)/AMP-acid ligase II